MRPIAIVPLICGLVFLQSCGGSSNNTSMPANGASTAASPAPALTNAGTPGPAISPAAGKVNVDVCALLTSAEIQAVQGEPLKGTKASEGPSGNFVTALCYYELPTPSNSVSLSLTQVDPDRAQSLKEFWETTFARSERKGEAKREKDRDKEKTKTSPQSEGEEEEAAAPAVPVTGVGDEAFWSGTRVGGALYVLKGNRFIRISVGGKGDNETKLKKSKTLASKALRRL